MKNRLPCDDEQKYRDKLYWRICVAEKSMNNLTDEYIDKFVEEWKKWASEPGVKLISPNYDQLFNITPKENE